MGNINNQKYKLENRKLSRAGQRIFRKMGYYDDQDGILRRYVREAQNWSEHLENTKSFICKAAVDKQKNKAAVLGSGWLLDVPFIELSSLFNEVWFFDIRHSAYVHEKVKAIKNIVLIETDISGFAEPLYNLYKVNRKKRLKFNPDDLIPYFDFYLDDFDFVVSCNIIDQLDDIPVQFLQESAGLISKDEYLLRMKIKQDHINILPKLKSCIIMDFEEQTIDRNDNLLKLKKLIFPEIENIIIRDTWLWKFDNDGMYNPGYKTWYKVGAIEI